MYWCLHIVVAVSFVLLPYIPTPKTDLKKSDRTSMLKNSNGIDMSSDSKQTNTVDNLEPDSNGIKKN